MGRFNNHGRTTSKGGLLYATPNLMTSSIEVMMAMRSQLLFWGCTFDNLDCCYLSFFLYFFIYIVFFFDHPSFDLLWGFGYLFIHFFVELCLQMTTFGYHLFWFIIYGFFWNFKIYVVVWKIVSYISKENRGVWLALKFQGINFNEWGIMPRPKHVSNLLNKFVHKQPIKSK